MAKNSKPSKRELIIQAANKIVQENGVQHLTLEATAAGAGVSKGGLLYHFRSKNELIEGMLTYAMNRFENEIEAGSKRDEQISGAMVRSYIRAATRHDQDMDSGLIAALLSNQQLLEPAAVSYGKIYSGIRSDGIDQSTALIACLAADGLWMLEMFGLLQLEDKERDKLIQALEKLARPDEGVYTVHIQANPDL